MFQFLLSLKEHFIVFPTHIILHKVKLSSTQININDFLSVSKKLNDFELEAAVVLSNTLQQVSESRKPGKHKNAKKMKVVRGWKRRCVTVWSTLKKGSSYFYFKPVFFYINARQYYNERGCLLI